MQEIRLSPSAINQYQLCPLSYLYSYIYKLKPKKDKDSTRIGTHWGKCHEILGFVPQGKCPDCLRREEIRADCYLCNGTGVLPADLMEAAYRYLDWAYETVPEHKTHEQWETERIKVLYVVSAYQWLYADSPFKIVASEVWYDLPIVDPDTNKKIPGAKTVGRLDHIVQDKTSGLYYVMERKSTSQSLTTQRYWNYLERNVQTVSYLWAARICQKLGRLEKYGIKRDDPLIEGVWYDVWHKPDINPRKVYKKELNEWEESGLYCGEKFDDCPDFETPQMYGARLMADMAERPDHYFARREFALSDDQLEAFQQKQAVQAKRIRHDLDKDWWVAHEGSCETPFVCEFWPVCSQGVKIGPLDVPEGYTKRDEKNTSN